MSTRVVRFVTIASYTFTFQIVQTEDDNWAVIDTYNGKVLRRGIAHLVDAFRIALSILRDREEILETRPT